MQPSWGSATDHRDYHSPGRPYSPIDSSSSPGHCCLLPSLPPLATLLASSPPLPPHSCTTTTYGHNRVVTDSPDRHRRFSHPLPLGTSTSPCMRSSSTSSQSLRWVTETTEDERGKTSVTSFAVGDPPHSKSDKGDLKYSSSLHRNRRVVTPVLGNPPSQFMSHSFFADASRARSGRCGSRSTATCRPRSGPPSLPKAANESPATCAATYPARGAAPPRPARFLPPPFH